MNACLHIGNVSAAVDQVIACVCEAARAAGMRLASAAAKRHLPYVTQELLQLRRDVWRAFRTGDVHAYQQLRAQYQHSMRFKKRVWLRHRTHHVLAQLKHDTHGVFKAYRGLRTSLPQSLQHPSHWQSFLQSLASPAVPDTVQQNSSHPVAQELLQAALSLNSPFDAQEVQIALTRLHNGKSPGFGGLCSEFFRYAQYTPVDAEGRRLPAVNVLVECIMVLVNAVFANGVVPAQWDLSLITPVHKRGSAVNTANYRPIAVGEPLAKLYATLLHIRLDSYLEANRLRSDSQAGFRRNLSTTHQLFLLQHFIDKHKHHKRTLYACYVDLKSAYDLVVRSVLWACLRRKGVHGLFLGALQSLYASPRYAISVGGLVGPSVLSTVGVRQGCPLSPLLFGLLLDDLTPHLLKGLHHAPCLEACTETIDSTEVRYSRRAVPNLNYADDILLLSTSLRGMQNMLVEFKRYCMQRGMLVNVSKTMLVQLVKGRKLTGDIQLPLRYGDQQLPFCASGARYLGLVVEPARGVRDAPVDLCQRAHRA
jgi:hypothetical protein